MAVEYSELDQPNEGVILQPPPFGDICTDLPHPAIWVRGDKDKLQLIDDEPNIFPEPYTKIPLGYDWHTLKRQTATLNEECKRRFDRQQQLHTRGGKLWASLHTLKDGDDAVMDSAAGALRAQEEALGRLQAQRRAYRGALTHVKQCRDTLQQFGKELHAEGRALDEALILTANAQASYSAAQSQAAAQRAALNACVDRLAETRSAVATAERDLKLSIPLDLAVQRGLDTVLCATARAWRHLQIAIRRSRRLDELSKRQRYCALGTAFLGWAVEAKVCVIGRNGERDMIARAARRAMREWRWLTGLASHGRAAKQRRVYSRCFVAWKKYTTVKRRETRVTLMLQRCFLRKVLREWYRIANTGSGGKGRTPAMRKLLVEFFCRWHRTAAMTTAGDMERELAVQLHHISDQQYRVFAAWSHAASWRQKRRESSEAERYALAAQRKQELEAIQAVEREAVSAATEILSVGPTPHPVWYCFQCWHEAAALASRQRTGLQLAQLHIRHLHMESGFWKWKSMARSLRRCSAAAKKAVIYSRRKLVTFAVSQWRRRAQVSRPLRRASKLVQARSSRTRLRRSYLAWISATTSAAKSTAAIGASQVEVARSVSALERRVAALKGDAERAKRDAEDQRSVVTGLSRDLKKSMDAAVKAELDVAEAEETAQHKEQRLREVLLIYNDWKSQQRTRREKELQSERSERAHRLAKSAARVDEQRKITEKAMEAAAAIEREKQRHYDSINQALASARQSQTMAEEAAQLVKDLENERQRLAVAISSKKHAVEERKNKARLAAEDRSRRLRQARSVQQVLEATAGRRRARAVEAGKLLEERISEVAALKASIQENNRLLSHLEHMNESVLLGAASDSGDSSHNISHQFLRPNVRASWDVTHVDTSMDVLDASDARIQSTSSLRELYGNIAELQKGLQRRVAAA